MNEKHMTSASPRSSLAVILAAGEGTRMKSDTPKVLHSIGGRSMLGHVIGSVRAAGIDAIAVVIGPGRDDVAAEVKRAAPEARIFVQTERLGTAHALLAARDALEAGVDDLLVLFADTPLIRPETLTALRGRLAEGQTVTALGFEAVHPMGYGRLVTSGASLNAIREHKDASEAERAITLCNSGLMAIDGRKALALVSAIGNANVQREYYLTDIVEEARKQHLPTGFEVAPEDEVMGVNDRVQLAAAEAVLQTRLRRKAMLGGATLVAPETVFLSHDTVIGRDVMIEPHVVCGPGVVIGDGVLVHAFCHLEQAQIHTGAQIGPFARMRPGADVGPEAKIGNFVELKNAVIGPGAKISHLSYIGDADVGARANIGAGTITCNYDGFFKYRTVIGEEAFVGANSSLVAPIVIGAGAYVGSGSVITKEVSADSLAVARGKQIERSGWAEAFRTASKAKKGR